MEIQFRAFSIEDFTSVQEMHVQSMRRLAIEYYTNAQLDADEKLIRQAEYLGDLVNNNIILATLGDKVIGSAGWCVHKSNVARVRKVFVSPDHAVQGIGRRLLMLIEDEIQKVGFMEVFCRASLNAVVFYEKFGFIKMHLAEMPLGDGQSMPVMLMKKTLGNSNPGMS